ncbi:hypothetical protein [Streptococcus chenjunshii]|uniref:hypothetical protein n=1 Tax=Streptococcus chenjunshii TaxID=2173853 RepID=UPI00115D0447|nr:hypothetical protein [Streptococcus chenjunshii]
MREEALFVSYCPYGSWDAVLFAALVRNLQRKHSARESAGYYILRLSKKRLELFPSVCMCFFDCSRHIFERRDN